MKLIRDEIRNNATRLAAFFFMNKRIPTGRWFDEKYVFSRLNSKEEVWAYRDAIDATVTNYIAKRGKTFVFSSKALLELPLHTALEPGHYVAPFPEMIFQFTHPIPEKDLGLTGAMPSGNIKRNDAVMGLVVGWPVEGGKGPFYDSENLINVIAYYQSTSFNRSLLYIDGNGSVAYERTIGGYVPGGKEDKQIITNLALWCIAYINSPKMQIEKVLGASEGVNRKREKAGKNKLEDYYILKVRDERIKYTPPPAGTLRVTGSKHSFKYDVRSHPRKLPTGKVIIIPAHQRGLENEVYKPKVYDVTKGVEDGNGN
jgi:hypothetical protein